MLRKILYIPPTVRCREVAEWFKAHAWNACWAQALEGSNPFLSAIPFSVLQLYNLFEFRRCHVGLIILFQFFRQYIHGFGLTMHKNYRRTSLEMRIPLQ